MSAAAARAAEEAARPHPPEIDVRYLGSFGPRAHPIAVFADTGTNVYNAREGDTLEGKFIVQRIGYESVDLAFVGFPDVPARRLGVVPDAAMGASEMTYRSRTIRILLVAGLAAAALGCSSYRTRRAAELAEERQDWDQAVVHYLDLTTRDPASCAGARRCCAPGCAPRRSTSAPGAASSRPACRSGRCSSSRRRSSSTPPTSTRRSSSTRCAASSTPPAPAPRRRRPSTR